MAIANTTPDPEYLSLLVDAGFELIPLHQSGVMGNGKHLGKAPMRRRGWWKLSCGTSVAVL